MRKAIFGTMLVLAAILLAGPVLALSGSGKVVAVEKDRVTLQLEKGQGARFPVGTRGIDISSAHGVTVRGRVVSVTNDKVIFRIMRGNASSLSVGAAVKLEQIVRTGTAEEMQGC